jgi:hypothetical protein
VKRRLVRQRTEFRTAAVIQEEFQWRLEDAADLNSGCTSSIGVTEVAHAVKGPEPPKTRAYPPVNVVKD